MNYQVFAVLHCQFILLDSVCVPAENSEVPSPPPFSNKTLLTFSFFQPFNRKKFSGDSGRFKTTPIRWWTRIFAKKRPKWKQSTSQIPSPETLPVATRRSSETSRSSLYGTCSPHKYEYGITYFLNISFEMVPNVKLRCGQLVVQRGRVFRHFLVVMVLQSLQATRTNQWTSENLLKY